MSLHGQLGIWNYNNTQSEILSEVDDVLHKATQEQWPVDLTKHVIGGYLPSPLTASLNFSMVCLPAPPLPGRHNCDKCTTVIKLSSQSCHASSIEISNYEISCRLPGGARYTWSTNTTTGCSRKTMFGSNEEEEERHLSTMMRLVKELLIPFFVLYRVTEPHRSHWRGMCVPNAHYSRAYQRSHCHDLDPRQAYCHPMMLPRGVVFNADALLHLAHLCDAEEEAVYAVLTTDRRDAIF